MRSETYKKILLITVLAFIVVLFLILWERYVTLNNIPKWILPKPSDIINYLYSDLFLPHQASYVSLLTKTLQSFSDALVGFLIAIILGVFIGLVFAHKEIFKIALSPFVFVTQLLPVPAFAPIVATILGFGSSTKIFIIVLFIIFPVIVSTEKAALNIPTNYTNLFKIYQSSKLDYILKLVIPGIIPSLFTTFKILCTMSFVTSIIAELPLTVSTGIGKDIYNSFNNQVNVRVWASLILISAISLLFFLIVSKTEEYILNRYRYGIN